MRESRLQADCLRWARTCWQGRVLAVNIHGGGWSNKGFPDLMLYGDGRAVAVELKADSGYRVQEDQMVWRSRLVQVGVHHYVVRGVDEFAEILEKEFGDEG